LASLVDRLIAIGQPGRGLPMAARIETPALALWKKAQVLGAQGQYAEMAKVCEEIEAMDTGEYGSRALRTRADLYRDRLARYADAIKLYAMINDPPGTIWSTVECYERMGKPLDAIDACTEIENFFAGDAPRACLRKAQVWQRAKDKERAIAALRTVIKKYPKHQVSSQAHQMLEAYGIKTGGGVIENE
jgi:tetratricopeptide (TPR) repeat protein